MTGVLASAGAVVMSSFGYVIVLATALAFVALVHRTAPLGRRYRRPGGLLNPITGVLLGTAVGREGLAAQPVCGLVLVLGGILVGQPMTARVAHRWRLPRPALG